MSRSILPSLSGPARALLPGGRPRPALVVAAGATMVLLLLGLTGPPAAAHTELIQGSPGPGQQVGGTVDFVDLAFLDAVSAVTVTVTLDGVEVPGAMTADEGRIVHFQFDAPLDAAGRYELSYALTAADGDRIQSGYSFDYEPSSPAPQRIGTPPAHDQGSDTLTLAAAAVLALVAVVGAVLLGRNLLELQRRRATVHDGRAFDEHDL